MRYYKGKNLFFVTLALFLFAFPGQAWSLTAEEIMHKTHLASYYQGDDGKAFVEMRIINKKGRVRKREFSILKKDLVDGGDQIYFVHFRKPNDVRNTTFLVKKHPGKDDDRWLYIPSIRMVKRVAASDKRGSFVGSHFTYEDISGRSPDLDVPSLLKEEQLDNETVYVIKNVPKNLKEVEYRYRHTYVSKDTFLTLKDVYFDKKDKPFKEYTVLEWKERQGFPSVLKSAMVNLKKKTKTEMDFSNVSYNIGLAENIFSERSLKRPPKKWIK